MNKVLWKDTLKSISKSKGRFLSIMGLMLIGSFALVGLKVTGPDMRETGAEYADKLNIADMTIIGSLGIDSNDANVIKQDTDISLVEYGYLKDVVIKETTNSVRIFSEGNRISDYELISEELPEKNNEIALDKSLEDQYKIGDTIKFTEKEDEAGQTVLVREEFKVVGFVYSGEILSSINLGVSTAGTGALKDYAVVTKDAFDSDVYMLARVTFDDLSNLDPYSDEYTDLLQKHKNDMANLLKDQPTIRLATVKSSYQKELDNGQSEINQAKQQLIGTEKELESARIELDNGNLEINNVQNQLNSSMSDAINQINDGEKQLSDAQSTITQGVTELENAKRMLDSSQLTIESGWNELQNGREQLEKAKDSLCQADQQLEESSKAISSAKQQVLNGYNQINLNERQIETAESEILQAENSFNLSVQDFNEKNEAYQVAINNYNQQLANYSSEVQSIDNFQEELNTALSEIESEKNQYETSINTLTNSKEQIEYQLTDTNLSAEELNVLQTQLANITQELSTLSSNYSVFIYTQYNPTIQEISDNQNELNVKKQKLENVKIELEKTNQELIAAKEQIDSGNIQLASAKNEIEQKQIEIQNAKIQLELAKITLQQQEEIINSKEVEYQKGIEEYNVGIKSYNENLTLYYKQLTDWYEGVSKFNEGSDEYQSNLNQLKIAENELSNKQNELTEAKNSLSEELTQAELDIEHAKTTLSEKQDEYDKKKGEFDEKKESAEKEISDQQEKLDDLQSTIDHLALPVYSIDSRREIPGGEGYKIYSSISTIVDALSNIFPVFLYFVAALVTLSTMTRFVEEERINSGTLKALGYHTSDILQKFIVYGLVSGLSGTILGIILGHTLLPWIVFSAYHSGFTVPSIDFQINWKISLIAILLSLISSVIPVFIVAKKELNENPAQLLVPKTPSGGSKIILERIKPIWNHMNFTHKVTARNIFRYKQRMMMTIFGVAGAVALLFAGLSVQYSIRGINNEQFGNIIHYDMIVAKNSYVTKKQDNEINSLLNSSEIEEETNIYYEELTTTAGDNKDTQEIKLIVPESTTNFSDFISLDNRKTGKSLTLPDDGVIISERLATLLNVKKGDTIVLNDEHNIERKMKISDISEMYMGHFVFTSKLGYETIFNSSFNSNAYLVNLKDSSTKNTEKQSAAFIDLSGVAGVVQNTTLSNQIDTIVLSLDKIMTVLIVTAALLAIVILYNLTNINVSERMRELSTIKVLGFYDKEVTMYIYRETIVLTIMGIFVGFGIGELLHQYIIAVVPPDDVMFNPALSFSSFIIPTIIISLVTIILALIINKRLKEVDMLEALKSVD